MVFLYEGMRKFKYNKYKVRLWIQGTKNSDCGYYDKIKEECESIVIAEVDAYMFYCQNIAEITISQIAELNAIEVTRRNDGAVIYRDWP